MAELIAEKEAKPGTDGSGLVGDVIHLGQDLCTDSSGWDTVVDTALVDIDILANCEDPLRGLISAGVGWLLEHFPGISEVWDKLTGDAQAIEQIAATWENIAKALEDGEKSYEATAHEIETWSGPARESYAKVSEAFASSIAGSANEAEGLAIVVKLVGGLVAACKDLIYTIIAEFIEFTVLPAILGAIATAWCTFGGSIGVAITYIEIQSTIAGGQITIKITKTTEEITVVSERTAKVMTKIARMQEALKSLHEAMEAGKSWTREVLIAAAHGETEQAK